MAILAVNAGSSTLKFSIYPLVGGTVQPQVLSGNIQGLEPGGRATLDWSQNGQAHSQALPPSQGDSFADALACLSTLLAHTEGIAPLTAVAHRVVHGGSVFSDSVVVTPGILAQLAQFNSLAPLHQPNNLKGIRALQQVFPQLPQVACFDTAFHSTIGALDHGFALPQALRSQGVRRYGFHGLSYQYVMGVLQEHTPERAQSRVLMAHLGNGASLCAARQGRSCATTMGFSALDGLMMGTRSGNLDPGVLLYLLEQGWDHARLQNLLYKESGLLGVSGISADMRTLRQSGDAQAQHAIDLFTHKVVREMGAMVASMDGLDAIAFSGGIGEHDVVLREEVCARLAWLGVSIDTQRNAQATGNAIAAIHNSSSRVEVWVVPTDEGVVAAREAARLVA